MRADELLKYRGKRANAKILGIFDREVKPLLMQQPGGDRASRMLRSTILGQINDIVEIAIDVANSGEAQHTEFNADTWMRRIDQRLAMIDERLGLSMEEEDPDLSEFPEPKVREVDASIVEPVSP